MQRQLHRIRPIPQLHTRQRFRLHSRPYSTRRAQSPQIRRQSIRHIHHRRCQFLLRQPPTQLQSRFRIHMLPQRRIRYPPHSSSGDQFPQSQIRLSQRSTHKQRISCLRTRPQYCPPRPHFAHYRYADKRLFPSRRIPARRHTTKFSRRPPQSVQKIRQPSPRQFRWQRQAQQITPRRSAHRRDITRCPRQ